MTERPAQASALRVVEAMPAGEWLSEATITDRFGHLVAPGFEVRSVLNAARRRSWLIRDNRSNPPLYRVTPTGVTAATRF